MTVWSWSDPSPQLSGSTHLWLTNCECDDRLDHRLLLDDVERTRWQRFRFGPDRRQFLIAHALLRRVLAYYLDREPATLEFSFGEHGKPALLDSALAFNLSHSGPYCLLAVNAAGEIGADVEIHRGARRFGALARRCFDVRECQVLNAFSGEAQIQYFYDTWAMKEAVIKAAGKGLAMPLREFGFRLDDSLGRLDLVWRTAGLDEARPWRVLLYRDIPALSLAICLNGVAAMTSGEFRLFQCDPGVSWTETGILPTLDTGVESAI